ncbi:MULTISPECIES: signal peptide peptidase SppA [unclassified Leptolyngbya]|uniref:signal peptide peptidase SppA n=1 Tax=unclassified Leptolyngbya TaxID=2650499 RepID=UPI001688D5CA|nr:MULTISPECIES: signal peptide peptidase SppA [unclassified Leptolyngbya]MBD1910765.1 signal peptide peptidase SppA [Leptolyngbya sp. FACHB-8]MBD2158841.1 signal peptide peptidase SppA [Leptolyngbya sp. FACHB-16]
MGKFIQQILATVIGLILFVTLGLGGLLLLAAIAAVVTEGPSASVKDDTILTLDLSHGITDANIDPPLGLVETALGLENKSRAVPLRVAIDAIDAAAKDDQIKALYITGTLSSVSGYATLEELRQALVDFRASGKSIYAYGGGWDERDYLLVSAADHIILTPNALMELNGLRAEMMFFAGALNKYGVGVQVIRAGQYKAAVEPFIRTDNSPAAAQQTQALLDDLWQEFVTQVAASRKLTPAKIEAIANQQGLLSAEAAKNAGLVDRLAYPDEMEAELQKLTGAEKAEDIHDISVMEYAEVADVGTTNASGNKQVALVYLNGDIVSSSDSSEQIAGDRTAALLKKLRLDDDVKAVVLRINSPGGSAFASELVAREIKLLHDTKPTIASMGNVAASGGYQLATYAHKIYASPATITGSIGVFGMVPNVQKLANDNGITWDSVQTNPSADLYSISRPRTPQELAMLQGMVDQTYTDFLNMVSQSRSLPVADVRKVAEGRVWSGIDAKGVGLVDELGGLETAIQAAAKQADLGDNWKLVEYPDAQPFQLQALTSILSRVSSHSAANDPLNQAIQRAQRELSFLQNLDDPKGVYARSAFQPEIR